MGTSCSISCWTNEVRSYWYHKRTLWCSAHDISKNQFFSSHYGGSNEAERAAAAAVAEAAAAMMIMMPRSFVLVSANAPALMKTNPPFNCSPAKRRFFTTIDSPAAENAAEKYLPLVNKIAKIVDLGAAAVSRRSWQIGRFWHQRSAVRIPLSELWQIGHKHLSVKMHNF